MLMQAIELGTALLNGWAEKEAREEKQRKEENFKKNAAFGDKAMETEKTCDKFQFEIKDIQEQKYGRNLFVNYERGCIAYVSRYGFTKEVNGSSIYEIERKQIAVTSGNINVIILKTESYNIYICENNDSYNQFKKYIAQKDSAALWGIYDTLKSAATWKQEIIAFFVTKALQENHIDIGAFCNEAADIVGKMTEEGKKAIANCTGNSVYTYIPYDMTLQKVNYDISKQLSHWLIYANKENIYFEVNTSEMNELAQSVHWIIPEYRENYIKAKKEKFAQNMVDSLIQEYDGDFNNVGRANLRYIEKVDAEIYSIASTDLLQYHRIVNVYGYLRQELANYNSMLEVVQNDSGSLDMAVVLVINTREALLKQKLKEFTAIALEATYGAVINKKEKLLRFLDRAYFRAAIELYKDYQIKYKELLSLRPYVKEYADSFEVINEQIEYYFHGSTLISKKINDLQKNKARCRYIDEDAYNNALMYIYSVDSIEMVNDILRRNVYLRDKLKGKKGEREVEHMLSFLEKDKYIIIPAESKGKFGEKCIILHNAEAFEHEQEYDHIVIGTQGVFVIETKNYSGKIIIDENGNWTRIAPNGKIKPDKHPFSQLKHHEKVIKSIVGDNVPIISILCLANPTIQLEGESNFQRKIVKSDRLTDYIEDYKTESVFSYEEMVTIAEKIKEYMK